MTVGQVRFLLGEEEFLTGIEGAGLRARTFDPSPTRRVQIPKASLRSITTRGQTTPWLDTALPLVQADRAGDASALSKHLQPTA